jgi:hypothetical protein
MRQASATTHSRKWPGPSERAVGKGTAIHSLRLAWRAWALFETHWHAPAEQFGMAMPRTDNGWTTPQLALVLMFFGAVTIVFVIKALVFGPPPYSVLAYVLGPVLLVAGYLVDRNAIRDLLKHGLKPPEPSAGDGG